MKFYWTARLYENGKLLQSKYFETQAERDEFAAAHEGWKKRGKICAGNLDKHLQEERNGI